MDYVMRYCPGCNRELPVPEDLKDCICMYCGEHFSIEEKLVPDYGNEELQAIEETYRKAFERLGELIERYDKLLQGFTREGYQTNFKEYAKLGEDILIPINRYILTSEYPLDTVVAQISERLMSLIEDKLLHNKGVLHKNSKAMLRDQYRFFLAVYLVPMLGYLKLELSDMLADEIMGEWKRRYPKSEFQKASYDELAAGFLRKGFCYITSAVCDTLNKPDDCYELTTFREFRDQYLMANTAGRRLVEEYYETAPRIVTYINMHLDREERYRKLWHQYLEPCLRDLECGKIRSCESRYIRMVRQLKKKMSL